MPQPSQQLFQVERVVGAHPFPIHAQDWVRYVIACALPHSLVAQPWAAGGYETAVGGAEDRDAFLKHWNTVCLEAGANDVMC